LVLQDPLASLDPVRRIGFQLGETRVTHGLDRRRGVGARAARVAWQDRRLRSLGFSSPDRVRHAVPAALSGGMRQRVCIGIASSADPPVLIADEPTTALDASLRGRVLRLLTEAGRDQGAALVLVSHDLSIVRTVADEVLVMYGGMVLEQGPTETVFAAPRSPYTVALLSCSVTLDQAEAGAVIPTIDEEGDQAVPAGCPFAGRCPLADDICWSRRPPLTAVAGRHRVACWHSDRADQTITAAGAGPAGRDGSGGAGGRS
jgi:peptide/nickel transport system ATP-binding protein